MLIKINCEFDSTSDLRDKYKMAYSISKSYHKVVSFEHNGIHLSVDKNTFFSNLEESYNNSIKSVDKKTKDIEGEFEVVKDE
jgi:hypothetical protein